LPQIRLKVERITMIRRLNAGDVRRTCDPASLGFESTEALEAPSTIIGQNRALKALQFGLQIQNSGFNIYAAGLPGTGKMTAITAFLERVAKDKETPADWCYVHNFDDPYRPRALKLKAGQAVQFQRDMRRLIETAQTDIRKAFDSEDYGKRREATARAFNVSDRSPAGQAASGVSGWGRKGPIPSMSAWSSFISRRSSASNPRDWPGRPTIFPVPTSYPDSLSILRHRRRSARMDPGRYRR